MYIVDMGTIFILPRDQKLYLLLEI